MPELLGTRTTSAQLGVVLPWHPRPTANGALLMHGDFATFVTNFAPRLADPTTPATGLAPYLAARDLDVWGFDRRWTQPKAPDADVSDFGEMGVVQEVDDIGKALAFARATRAVTGSGLSRLALVGFSHGGQLAYLAASVDAKRPTALRQIKALVPIDIYAEIAPEDADLRAFACDNAAYERGALVEGAVDSPNDFFITLGERDRTDPGGSSEYFAGRTNHEALLIMTGRTYAFVPYTPLYHLAAPVLVPSSPRPIGLRETPIAAIDAWFASAPPHQSMREAADLDGLWCGQGAPVIDAPLSRIHVPLFYLGAAGSFGSYGLYSTTRVSSSDVSALVVHRFGADRVEEDLGHGDLLYAADAPALAWQPLATWLLAH